MIGVKPDWSNREIADAAGVSDMFVGKVRRKIQTDALQTVCSAEGTASEDASPDYPGRVRRWSEKFALAATLSRQLRTVLVELLDNPQASHYLRQLRVHGVGEIFVETPRLIRNDRRVGGWTTPGLDVVLAAIEQGRVDHVCAACHGKGCSACGDAGFSPKQLGQYITDPQLVIEFA